MKNKFKLIGFIAIMAIIGFSMTSCGEAGSNDDENITTINLTIKNSTGFQGHHLYVDPSTSTAFSSSKLGKTESLENGQSKTVVLPAAGSYDMRIVTGNNNVYTKYNVNVTSSMTVTFTSEDLDTNDGGLPVELIGTWYPIVEVGDFSPDTFLNLSPNGTGSMDGVYCTWTVNSSKLILTIDDYEYDYVYSIKDSVLTLTANGKTGTYSQDFTSDASWPSDDVWASFGLSGFTQPAGSIIRYAVVDITWYNFFLKDDLYVVLNAGSDAFDDLRYQLDELDIDYDVDIYNTYLTANYNSVNLTMSYDTGSITIIADKPIALYNNSWAKGSGADYRVIIFGWDDARFFIGSVELAEITFDLHSDGSVEAYYYLGGDAGYADINFSFTLEGDTLTISDLNDNGVLELSSFNGVYTLVGG